LPGWATQEFGMAADSRRGCPLMGLFFFLDFDTEGFEELEILNR